MSQIKNRDMSLKKGIFYRSNFSISGRIRIRPKEHLQVFR